MRQRILITGISGFLGQYLARSLRDRHHVIGTYLEHPPTLPYCVTRRLDLTDANGLASLCREFRPEVIVHLAAWSNLDRCQRDPGEAFRVNVQGTMHVAQAAVAVGARLIYSSTDMVYDGTKGLYNEADPPHPLMVYGRMKLEGEEQAAAIGRDVVILRLALMYGWGKPAHPNFIDWLLARLQAGQDVPLFVDQYRTPLSVLQAAEAIDRLIEMPDVHGLFNLGGAERLDRFTFGRKFCAVFELPTKHLKPVAMADIVTSTPRPRDCSMSSAKISAPLGLKLLTVDDGLQALRRQRHA